MSHDMHFDLLHDAIAGWSGVRLNISSHALPPHTEKDLTVVKIKSQTSATPFYHRYPPSTLPNKRREGGLVVGGTTRNDYSSPEADRMA